jgi:hypothetical protein
VTASETILNLANVKEDAVVHSPEWYRQLVDAVNKLVVNDFSALIQILYRLDVSEEKIRVALANNPNNDAADLIAKLLLERQVQKLESRKAFRQKGEPEEDERW